MSEEPVRLKDSDDAPEGLRRILRDANAIAPMPAELKASLLAKAPAPAKASALASPAVIGAGALGVAVVAAILWQTRSVSTPDAKTPAPTTTTSASAEPAPPPTIEPAPAADPSSAPTPLPSARPSRPAPKADGDTLAEESLLVGRARANLVSNPTAALSAIDEHARRFPRGELAPEREYLRVSALHRLGRDDEARARGRAYLTTHSSSPYAPAVRSLLLEMDGR